MFNNENSHAQYIKFVLLLAWTAVWLKIKLLTIENAKTYIDASVRLSYNMRDLIWTPDDV